MIAAIQKALLKGNLTAPGAYGPITARKLLRHHKVSNGSQTLRIESPYALDRPVSVVKIMVPVVRL